MAKLVIILVLIFMVTLLSTYVVKIIALKRKILDIPNPRSSHFKPIPRGGGLAIVLTWFPAVILLFIKQEIPESLFLALISALPVSFIGMIDDIVSISPKLRISIQIICALLAVFFIGGLPNVDIGFTTLVSPVIFNLLAVIGIVWFTNLFNFLDGIDGYIGTEVIFICLAVFLLNGIQLPLFLAASVAGFLVWNWQPAKIFMGDVGSTLLGFTIGIFVIYYQKSSESSVFIWLILTSLFWFDASLTLFRRWRKNEQLSHAHKKHAYQRIIQYGFSHQKVVIYSIFINLSLLCLTWLAIKFPVLTLPFFLLALIYLYFIVKLVDKKLPFRTDIKENSV